jgi:hypothetical protein
VRSGFFGVKKTRSRNNQKMTFVTFIALTFFAALANACTSRPPPPPPPPPNAPPAPPVPPPIVKVVRQQEQVTTLNVCHKECSGQTVSISATGDIIPSTVLGGTCGEPPGNVFVRFRSFLGFFSRSFGICVFFSSPFGLFCAVLCRAAQRHSSLRADVVLAARASTELRSQFVVEGASATAGSIGFLCRFVFARHRLGG